MTQSLYWRLGGGKTIVTVMTSFYQKVMEDESLQPFFQGINVDAQIKKQVDFLTIAFGEPSTYTAVDLRRAHARLVENGMNDAHFDRVVDHLRTSLAAIGITDDLIAEVVVVLEGTRKDVLNR